MHPVLDLFHPAVASWFHETLGEPTPPQVGAWPALLEGRDALVAAPTGSGKTLAAFLAALDVLTREAELGALPDEVRVVYVSPLKALSNDIHKNLMLPLEGILARTSSTTAATLRAAVRTGDTSSKDRADAIKKPPHILVTTPESLYVLLTSASGRKMLSTARTVILDEIHAVAPSRRGAHLALTIERLEHACLREDGRKLQRVGLSATQKPVEEVARYLVGTDSVDGRVVACAATDDAPAVSAVSGLPRCLIVDEGHKRTLDLAVEIPRSPLEAVMSGEVWNEVIDSITELVLAHKTTLVFVNTRRLAERVASRLESAVADRLASLHSGANVAPSAPLLTSASSKLVCAHHGSMSKDKRFDAERRLKNGELRALVATASLELGIDVGSVDLVVQIGATKTIAALLQRVGRAGHHKTLIPKGRIFPLSRDELLEAAALVSAVKAGALDALRIPTGGLDVLAQQLVACAGDADWQRPDLRALVRRAWPYRDLSDKDFDDALALVAHGVPTSRGRRGAHVFFDATADTIKGRKGARLAALTSGGAIPDQGDYNVVESPNGAMVGTINEDFAIESMPGDVFQLGTASWRILKVERGVVRVEDAKGQPPSLPFWLGEAPARSIELSEHVSELRDRIDVAGASGEGLGAAVAVLTEGYGLPVAAAHQAAEYLLATRNALGTLPTTKRVVFERFLDELGGSQIVVHAPFGARVNRAWGLALRKRFCRSFDFELQAAATEDAVLLSVGAVQGVDITQIPHFLTSKSVRRVLVQALLDAPMFGTRFRWNASRALTMLRMRGGKRVPPGLQRIEAEDLLVSLFPEQLACLENIVGDREVPDALLIRQTVEDCLTEVMDIDGLERVLLDIEEGRIEVRCVESTEPSPLAHEILGAKPYAFLDDAPLEERRVQAVFVRRSLEGANAEGGALEPRLVAEVLEEVHPAVESVDEAHDAILVAGFLRDTELHTVGGARMPALIDELQGSKRVIKGGAGQKAVLFAVERASLLAPLGITSGSVAPFASEESRDRRTCLIELLRARAEVAGPKTAAVHAHETGVPLEEVKDALAELVRTGDLLQGRFDHHASEECTWSRRLVTRVRRRMLERLRKEIEPVVPRDLVRFLVRWQRVESALGEKPRGVEGVRAVLALLEGTSVPAAAWEEHVLPARVDGYDPVWLDQLCLSGQVQWGRLEAPRADFSKSNVTSLRSAPIAILPRGRASLFTPVTVDEAALSDGAKAVLATLRARGAMFFLDIASAAKLAVGDAEDALADLVAAGLVTSDGFAGLRALLLGAKDRERVRRRRMPSSAGLEATGRWALVETVARGDGEAHHEEVARTLLRRTGVLFRKLVERDESLPPWRELLWALRRLEARGEIRGGRFVNGFSGEQFALPEAIGLLRAVRREPLEGKRVVISAADPLNLTGGILPGARIPSVASHRILLEDGVPIAVLDGSGVRVLTEGAMDANEIERALKGKARARAVRASQSSSPRA